MRVHNIQTDGQKLKKNSYVTYYLIESMKSTSVETVSTEVLDNKANLRDLIAATGLVFLLKIGFKSLIFEPMWPGNLIEDHNKSGLNAEIPSAA